ncbi:hypothetical protein BJ165DRAFT_1592474 [Panaeolus papilionaceus]|nr:hypothetical protein BJ165DRAFT_1592474 [Panaeolus papilionaceus]
MGVANVQTRQLTTSRSTPLVLNPWYDSASFGPLQGDILTPLEAVRNECQRFINTFEKPFKMVTLSGPVAKKPGEESVASPPRHGPHDTLATRRSVLGNPHTVTAEHMSSLSAHCAHFRLLHDKKGVKIKTLERKTLALNAIIANTIIWEGKNAAKLRNQNIPIVDVCLDCILLSRLATLDNKIVGATAIKRSIFCAALSNTEPNSVLKTLRIEFVVFPVACGCPHLLEWKLLTDVLTKPGWKNLEKVTIQVSLPHQSRAQQVGLDSLCRVLPDTDFLPLSQQHFEFEFNLRCRSSIATYASSALLMSKDRRIQIE